ncbi:hypothetical protein MKX03_021002, partial [Papaver bracteatum]
YAVRNGYQDLIDEIVRKPIENMELDNLDFLFIPMNISMDPRASGHHWTLLVLDVKCREWRFLNSLVGSSVEDPCLQDARKMASFITPIVNTHLVVTIDKLKVHQFSCPHQGPKPDCLLFTCYLMKRYAKSNKSIEMDDKKAREICREMRHKMAAKMLRPCVSAIVWNAPNANQP